MTKQTQPILHAPDFCSRGTAHGICPSQHSQESLSCGLSHFPARLIDESNFHMVHLASGEHDWGAQQMVFEEQDVVASHNTSSQMMQQKVCKCLFSSSVAHFYWSLHGLREATGRNLTYLKYSPGPEAKTRSFSESLTIPRVDLQQQLPPHPSSNTLPPELR